MRVGGKVHWLTKILSWNVTKRNLFFKIDLLAVCTLLQLVLQCLDPIGKKSTADMNFSFFKIDLLAVHTLLPSVLQCLDPTVKKKVINSRYIFSSSLQFQCVKFCMK